MKLGWIGLGNMGIPISMNLLRARNAMVVTDIIREHGIPLRDAGADWADTSCEVAQQADIIFTMVPNGKILKSVIMGENGVASGLTAEKIVVDMSTIAPVESAEVAAAVEAKGCQLLRAPVTGSTVLAEKAALGILASGKKELYDTLLPYFLEISNKQFYLGEGERARVLKLAINLMVGINMQMLAEAMLLADKAGLDRTQTLEIIAESAAGAPVIQYKKDPIARREYTAAFSVAMMEKDFDLTLDTAKQYGAALPLTALTRQFLGIADASGMGQQDFSILVELLAKLCS